MRVRSITYSRLKVVRQFENERAEVTIELGQVLQHHTKQLPVTP